MPSGQAMVEFALGLPILLLLLLGLIEIGRAVMTYNVVGNVAREGAHYAIMLPALNAPSDPSPQVWEEYCNRGLDESLDMTGPTEPKGEMYLGNDAACGGWANVVSAVMSKAVVLRPADTKIYIAYDRVSPVPTPYGLEGYNRGVPLIVTVRYDHRLLVGQFLGLPGTLTMTGSSTMITQ
jgi:hypothetical protein